MNKINYSQTGGAEKIIPEYIEPRNNPAVPNEAKQIFGQRKAENPPREITPTINFQYYQPPKPKDKGLQGQQMYPQYSQQMMLPAMYPGYFGFPYSRPLPQYVLPPVVKNIHITTDGPTARHQRLALIHEDVMPAKPFVPSSTTLGERLNMYQFIRSSIFSNTDGEDISMDGTESVQSGGAQSLLSYIKFGDLNPYNTYKLSNNIYRGMPEGYLIYRTCYPIRESEGSAICAKDSTGVNVRIYKMLEGSFLVNKINPDSFSKYDEWREVAFYEYLRENIIKKKICPHFTTLYGYFISEKCNIDFDAIEEAKFGSKKMETGVEPQYITQIELDEKKNKDCTIDDKQLQVKKAFVESLDEEGNFVETIISTKDDTVYKNSSNLEKVLNPLSVYTTMYNAKNIAKNPDSGFNPFKTSYGNIPKDQPISKIRYTNKDNVIVEVNPYAYLGKSLVLLTESPTYNLIGWATKTYQQSGNVKEMVNRGIHTENEWMNVLFQMMIALYVMQINGVFIRNFSIENNVMIKDLTLRGAITNYWKYKINDMDFYLPNLGYLVLIDSNYKDLDNNTALKSESTFNKIPITNTYKVDGKFLGKDCKLNEKEIKDSVFEMFKNSFNVNIFDKTFDKNSGCRPDGKIIDMMTAIYNESMGDNNKDIAPYIIKYMTKFLHNRTGTYLREAESLNIRRDDTREFKKGQLVVYEDGYGTFKFVIYLDTENGKSRILTKGDTTDDDITIQTVPVTSLFNYSRAEPIAQNYKPNEANLNDDDLLETYVIKE